jgi:hypothetical protein
MSLCFTFKEVNPAPPTSAGDGALEVSNADTAEASLCAFGTVTDADLLTLQQPGDIRRYDTDACCHDHRHVDLTVTSAVQRRLMTRQFRILGFMFSHLLH